MAAAVPLLLHVFPSFVAAGSQVRTARLIDAFGGAFRHSIVAMDGRTDARELIGAGIRVSYPEPPPKAGTLATIPRMRRMLRELAPNLVLTYNFGALDTIIAARTLGTPVVHHEDGFHPDEAAGFKRRRVWLRRTLLPGTFRTVVISDTLRRIALELWKLHPQKVEFIANGIDADRFRTRDGHPELRAELGIPAGAFVIGAVGHLRPEKNLPRLFEATSRLLADLDAHVLVLGDGPQRPALERLAAQAPLRGRVHFAGHQADLIPYYRAMDLFALTSDTEQMPISLLEAMASRLPVVATNVGDVRAMLPGEQAAFLALPGGEPCTDTLASALRRMLGDAQLRERLGAKNQGRVRNSYSQAGMVKAYGKLYRAALG
jgi:glycosyltransferase involved in cell wall biosynthesis